MVRAVDESWLANVTRLLCQSAQPTRIILFGSHARGDARTDSDIDLLVVVPQSCDRMAEMVRLNRVLSPLRLPVDLLVATADQFRHWRDTPGNIYSTAAAEGKVLYEQTA
ncbi:MAG TPA: nucleotidyltransferase domain-containing protein [Phycisphaerae bacterium]|nr:nucleotidyltransferase domain-containing protein [Phycisphaerae bacterium]